MYSAFKFMHLLGVVLLLGNVTASAVWKVFANRTGNAVVVVFAQKLVSYTDWSLTLGGVVLVMVGGYGMTTVAGLDLRLGWLLWGQVLFLVSGVIWLARLVPIQIAQSRMTKQFVPGSPVPREYRTLCTRWIAWGAVATVPLVAATWVMVGKF
jgi:uncharacterized membrane protein